MWVLRVWFWDCAAVDPVAFIFQGNVSFFIGETYFIKYENPVIGRQFKFPTAWFEFSNI